MTNRLNVILLVGVLVLAPQVCSGVAVPDGKPFPSADAAARALVQAAKTDNVSSLIEILGPSARSIVVTRDSVADRNVRRQFAARAAEKVQLIPDHRRANAITLLVGNNEWPLPVPIVKVKGRWYFDTAQGKREILARRIGSNELDAIEICRGYVEAQNDYAAEHKTDQGVPVYAQKIISSPGQHDGLFDLQNPGEETPISKFIVRAFHEKYTNRAQPYHGYYFRVLTSHGPHAPGGAMSYLEDGKMTRGFALIAWPSNYGATGVMTFLVDKAGIVYQKDLGPNTGQIAAAYTAYDPDDTWTPVSG